MASSKTFAFQILMRNVHTTPTVSSSHKKPSKKTCWDNTQSKNTKKQAEQKQKQNTAHGKRSRTLSESRRETFGINSTAYSHQNCQKQQTKHQLFNPK